MSQIVEKYPIVREAFANPLIQEAVREFRRFQSDPEMRELERRHHLFMVGYHQDLSVSRAEGRADGKAKRIETVRNFKQLGVDYETITKATGLSFDEIEYLN